jgi:hypothetical protein
MRAKRGVYCVPVNRRIRVSDSKVGDNRLTVDGHVRGRGEISRFDVLQLTGQRLLRRAPGARIPLDRALIDHDRKSEAGMLFGLLHHELRGLIHGITRPVPIDNHAIDATADHVVYLALDLVRIGGAVADIHVI